MKTEMDFWSRGITTWDDLLSVLENQLSLAGFEDSAKTSGSFQYRARDFLTRSEAALRNQDAEFFAKFLPRPQWWRMFDDFRSSTVYLDIETTGLSRNYHEITLVGCYDGQQYQVLFPGGDISDLGRILSKASLLVTFNGILFDIPFLSHKFPTLQVPPVHLDLRFLLRTLGLAGGLKQIETTLGMERPSGGAVDGREAVELWYRYLRGDTDSLRRLVQYNYDDTVGMKYLAEYAVASLKRSLPTMLQSSLGVGQPICPAPRSRTRERPGLEEVLNSIEAPQTKPRPTIKSLLQSNPESAEPFKVVGIDLTGSETRASGWAFLDGAHVTTSRVRTDQEIIEETLNVRPDVVSIDSPLSLPVGTILGDDGTIQSFQRIHRDSELELRRRGVAVYWCLLPSMQSLTLRGMRLAKALRRHGLRVIESFPGAAQDILGMPRKGKSTKELAFALEGFGVDGDSQLGTVSHDELDAITSAIVGIYYLSGKYEALGSSDQDDLIVPLTQG